MEIVNRKSAAQRGDTTFFTGKACKNGHVAPRYVSTGHCVECVKMAARAYRGGLAAAAPTVAAIGATPDDIDLAVSDRIEALRRAHRAAVRKLEADLDLAIENAKAKGEQDKRHLRARQDAAVAAQTVAAQQQAERQEAALRQSELAAFKKGLRRIRAKIEAGREAEADAYVWAVAMARCESVALEDVSTGPDKEYGAAGVRGYLAHPDDVDATVQALKAYAPPVTIAPPVPMAPSDTSSSDWLHQ